MHACRKTLTVRVVGHAVWHPADADVAAPVESMTAAMAELEEQLAHSLLLANHNNHINNNINSHAAAAAAPPRESRSRQAVSPPRHLPFSRGA